MITDTHLGVRNSLEEWIEIQRSYFYDEFISLVRKEYRPGDVLFHLGDVFDSRHAITLKVLDLAIDVFEVLGSIFVDGVYVISGNHDCWYKTTNQINSLKVLKRIPNINIIDMMPETIRVHNKNFLMLPWQKDHATGLKAIEDNAKGHDYLMCHMDVYGMKGSRFGTIDYGLDVAAFSVFEQVYSGHIHYRQKMRNVTMLGTPYELTRSDMYNEKAITVLDVETGTEVLYPNRTSPRFVGITMSAMLEKSPEELKAYGRNMFLDIYMDDPNFLKIPVNSIIDLLDNVFRGIKIIPPNVNGQVDHEVRDEELKDFDIRDTIREYCAQAPYDDDMSARLEKSLMTLYDKVVNEEAVS